MKVVYIPNMDLRIAFGVSNTEATQLNESLNTVVQTIHEVDNPTGEIIAQYLIDMVCKSISVKGVQDAALLGFVLGQKVEKLGDLLKEDASEWCLVWPGVSKKRDQLLAKRIGQAADHLRGLALPITGYQAVGNVSLEIFDEEVETKQEAMFLGVIAGRNAENVTRLLEKRQL